MLGLWIISVPFKSRLHFPLATVWLVFTVPRFPGKTLKIARELGTRGSYLPVRPSISSRTMSRCPTCRAYSCGTWNRMRSRVAGCAPLHVRRVAQSRSACERARSRGCARLVAVALRPGWARSRHRRRTTAPPRSHPWLVDRHPLEAPPEPAHLHVCQVLEQAERRPARRQQTGAQLLLRQILQFGEHHRPGNSQDIRERPPLGSHADRSVPGTAGSPAQRFTVAIESGSGATVAASDWTSWHA